MGYFKRVQNLPFKVSHQEDSNRKQDHERGSDDKLKVYISAEKKASKRRTKKRDNCLTLILGGKKEIMVSDQSCRIPEVGGGARKKGKESTYEGPRANCRKVLRGTSQKSCRDQAGVSGRRSRGINRSHVRSMSGRR